jgi:DsbC/DsbD-like thiol-disulfide interchange protein
VNASHLVAGCLAWAAALPAAARAQAPLVDVSAVPEYASVQPGSAFRVAIRAVLPAGWHIYWINPGPSGLPTTVAWHLPAGVTGGDTEWPFPETDDAGGEVSNVYRGTVVAFSSFVAPATPGRITLRADLVWGLCRLQCVRQERTVEATVRVTNGAAVRSPAWAEAEAATRLLPMRQRGATLTAAEHDDSVRLVLAGLRAGPAPGSWVTYFPLQQGLRSIVAPVRAFENGLAVVLPRAAADSARLIGLLVAAHAPGAPPPVRAIAVDVPVTR